MKRKDGVALGIFRVQKRADSRQTVPAPDCDDCCAIVVSPDCDCPIAIAIAALFPSGNHRNLMIQDGLDLELPPVVLGGDGRLPSGDQEPDSLAPHTARYLRPHAQRTDGNQLMHGLAPLQRADNILHGASRRS